MGPLLNFHNILLNAKKNIPIGGDDLKNSELLMAHFADIPIDNYNYLWQNIMFSEWSAGILKRLDRLGILSLFFPEVTSLKNVIQNKKRTLDAFDHTLKVVNCVDKLFPRDIIKKWAALFHDIGKADCVENFHDHARYSFERFYWINNRLKLFDYYDSQHIAMIIKYHMVPLQYQRYQNWDLHQIKKFNNICYPYTMSIIDFSMCDKMAHHNNPSYLDPLLDLKKMIITILEKENA